MAIKLKIHKDGLKPIYKLMGQAVLGLAVGLTLWLSPDAVIRENITISRTESTETVIHKSEPVKSTITTIPFVKNNNLNYSEMFSFMGKYATAAGWIFFVIMVTFVVMAVSNGSNMNDGMDGMCAGNSAIMGIALAILAYVSSHVGLAGYLNIMFIPESEELVIFLLAFVGALIGFLWYNAYPAQVFMGDTGSLAIGGIIAVFALCIRKELLLPIMCGIFLAEAVSVMVQVSYFKYTKRKYGEGRRILLMSPLHHHYQKQGIFETKVMMRFTIISLLLAAISLITLKIR